MKGIAYYHGEIAVIEDELVQNFKKNVRSFAKNPDEGKFGALHYPPVPGVHQMELFVFTKLGIHYNRESMNTRIGTSEKGLAKSIKPQPQHQH
jgi:hypothetical protein